MPLLSHPVHYSLEITSACNGCCKGCGNVCVDRRRQSSTESIPSHLPGSVWQTILTQIQPYAYRLRITGGEPTLHPDFEIIVSEVQKLDIFFTLFTNARWPNPKPLLSFLAEVPQLLGLLVSLHGADVTAHEAFTNVPGSFAQTTENIKATASRGLTVATSTAITSFNYFQVEELVTLSHQLGAKLAIFNRYVAQGGDSLQPTDTQLRTAIETVDDLREKGIAVKLGNCIPQCFARSSSIGCWAGFAYCTIDPWGNVRPCNHASLICGNLLEQSIEEIWQGEQMEYWRSLVPRECLSCTALNRCHAGCQAIALELGLDRDPLMRGPIPENVNGLPEELILYEAAKPVGRFDIRPEDFGYVLLRGNRLTLVTREAKEVLDICDGTTTLHQIEERFGEGALSLVGSLLKKGFLELQ